MRERLYYEVEGKKKKEVIEALKNEQKITKKIPIMNSKNEEIAKILKWDDYYSYIDFWLDDLIDDNSVNKNGKISSLEISYYEKKEGVKIPRIKSIVA